MDHEQALKARLIKLIARLDRSLEARSNRSFPDGLKLTPPVATIDDAFQLLHDSIGPITTEAAQQITACARTFIDPKLLEAALRQDLLTSCWPWPRAGNATNTTQAMTALYCLRVASLTDEHGAQTDKPLLTTLRGEWPPDVLPLDVAQWAKETLNQTSPSGKAGDLLLRLASDGLQLVDPGDLTLDHDTYVDLQATGLALLYLAEHRAKLAVPAPFQMSLVAVDPPPVRTITSLGGTHPQTLSDSAKLFFQDPNDPTRLDFTWDDGSQLELELYPASCGPLVAVSYKYGIAAVRDILALYAFTWAARANARESLWWWPDEHLELVGLANSKDNRKRLKTWLDAMTRCQLTVRYKTGSPLTGPLVSVIATDGSAHSIHLHPALYRGVTGDDGRWSNKWWPVPMALLRMPADHSAGKIHVLAPVLGSMWRASLAKGNPHPVARIGTKRLAKYLASGYRIDRDCDPIAAKRVEKTLEAGKQAGFINDWKVERGSLDRFTGVLVATPGKQATEVLDTGDIPKPAWIPQTGNDLKRWMHALGISSVEASTLLGIPDRTLRRARSDYGDRPLPPRIRKALRTYLW